MTPRIKPVVKLRKLEFERRVSERFRTNEQAADAMFLDRTSYWRAVRGLCRIGEEFIAGALYGLNCEFEDIFKVVKPDPTTVVREFPDGRRDNSDSGGEPDGGSGVALHA